jgi:hypothetical protein
LPTCRTASPSFCASASRKRASSGASRYWIGVSTVAIAATKRGSAAAMRAASRSFASAGSGVPAGANIAAPGREHPFHGQNMC